MIAKGWLKLLPAIIWASVIAFLMLTPQDTFPESKIFTYDKLGHIGVFAILSLLLLFGISKSGFFKKIQNKRIVCVLCLTIFYGAGLEFLQRFSPGRASDLYDLIANIVGAFIGVLVFSIFIKNKFVILKLIL